MFRTACQLLFALAMLVLPIACATFIGACLIKPQTQPLWGTNLVGKTRLYGALSGGELRLALFTGWQDKPPERGMLFHLPGIRAGRSVVTITGDSRGDVITSIYVRWWLLISFNVIALALLLLRRLWRRSRIIPGRCAICGYDLRASPERCSECGTVCCSAPASADNPSAP
jgi:hypothetical protein